MNLDNVRIAEAYNSINEKFKNDLVGENPDVNTIAILTAENPMAVEMSPSVNKTLNNQLVELLKKSHLVFRRIEGRYGSIEHSFMISNIGLDEAASLAARFGQQSFIFGRKSEFDSDEERRNARGKLMSYEFWALKKDRDIDNAEKSVFTQKDGSKIEVAMPKSTDYVKVDERDRLNYHSQHDTDFNDDNSKSEVDSDDFYSRRHGFKYDMPFEKFADESVNVIESMNEEYRSIRGKIGNELFERYLSESMDESKTMKWRWQNRSMMMHDCK